MNLVAKRKGTSTYYTNFSVNGKRVRKSTKTTDKVLAKKLAMIEKEKEVQNVIDLAKGIRLSKAIERTYDEKWSKNKTDMATLSKAGKLVEILTDKYLHEITYDDVVKIAKYGKTVDWSNATVNRYLALLKVVMNMGRKWGSIQALPYFPMLKEPKGRIKILTPQEESIIIDYFTTKKNLVMVDLVTLLINTGMRLSEALNLTTGDVDFANNMIRIWENKTDTARSIPMTKKVFDLLCKRCKDVECFPLSVDQVESYWKRMRKDMGIEDKEMVIHALRHTFASRLVLRGVDLYKVKALLGHNSIKTTERYAHLQNDSLQDAIKTLE